MSQDPENVRCASCGQALESCDVVAMDGRLPCSGCGAMAREIAVRVADEISGWDTVHAEGGLRRGEISGRKRPYVDAVFGRRELTVSTGRTAARTKVQNRRDDLYSEVVTDVETGEILHEAHETLSGHKGHGSARKSH